MTKNIKVFIIPTGYAFTEKPYIANNIHPIEFIILSFTILVITNYIAIIIEAVYPTHSIAGIPNIKLTPF